MQAKDLKKIKIPDCPGVYFFYRGKRILYIGKATSLRDRVRSYFREDLIVARGPGILDMTVKANKIDWKKTDSVLEALILESALIKKHQPHYNVQDKDDKSWNYVCISKDSLPKILIVRGRNLKRKDYNSCFGPFTSGSALKEALKIIRRIFPYFDSESSKKNNKVFYSQLGLTPEGIEEYKNNIKHLKLFFQGKKKKILQELKRKMKNLAKDKKFEQAGEIKRQIFALEHINDIALIKEENLTPFIFSVLRPSPNTGRIPRTFKTERDSAFSGPLRIEAYDVAHLSGKNMVGVMTVTEGREPAKSEYKKFIVRSQTGANDTGALEEILSRRFRHSEWGLPDLVVVDGSDPQINVAKRVLLRYRLKIPVVSVVKDERHKARAIKGDETIIKQHGKAILLANAEAHRFAIKFYRSKSRKNLLK